MDDCTQEAMHVLSITACRTTVTEKLTYHKNLIKSVAPVYRLRSNMDDCIQVAMLRYMQVLNITAVGPIATQKRI